MESQEGLDNGMETLVTYLFVRLHSREPTIASVSLQRARYRYHYRFCAYGMV